MGGAVNLVTRRDEKGEGVRLGAYGGSYGTARATVQVSRLPKDAGIEIDVIAVVE